jgi:hypothetical protein
MIPVEPEVQDNRIDEHLHGKPETQRWLLLAVVEEKDGKQRSDGYCANHTPAYFVYVVIWNAITSMLTIKVAISLTHAVKDSDTRNGKELVCKQVAGGRILFIS